MEKGLLIRLGILLVGFSFAGVLPYSVKKSIQHLNFDLSRYTLSFLSNKQLYGKNYVRGYKRTLFLIAILVYIFFLLLSSFYDLGANKKFMQYIDYSFALLAILAFVPHNINPYSFKNLKASLQRFLHNLLAITVFLTLPTLIIIFQTAILHEHRLFGISGLIIVGTVIAITIISLIKNGINGVTEMFFINGISIWTIFVTILTFIR